MVETSVPPIIPYNQPCRNPGSPARATLSHGDTQSTRPGRLLRNGRNPRRNRREWAAAEGLNPDAIEKMYSDLVNHFISEEMKHWQTRST
jgi:hypothetical protein